jgi:hypothetical protein
MEYANYAHHCMKIVNKIPDQESRMIHREMAAEWLKLADQAANGVASPSAQATGESKADHG